MSKGDRRTAEEQSRQGQRQLPLRELVREALFDTVIVSGLEYVGEVLEEERTALCGPRYQHDRQRRALRAGSGPSSLSLGGRRVAVERPRARSVDGEELTLPSWRAWSARDPLEQRAIEQMLVGVSTRRYPRSLEALPGGLRIRGIGKSAVSERFVLGTARKLAALMQRKLGGLQLIAVMIDGVRFADHVVLAAVGVDTGGKKHVLGLREGATENTAACKALLADLIERGLSTERTLLFVIDGAKALRNAIGAIFGPHHPVQRCRIHKIRNVLDRLPRRLRPDMAAAMRAAYRLSVVEGEHRLRHLASSLECSHPAAARSLLEGLDEIFTLNRLNLPLGLHRCLSSTNIIESPHAGVRMRVRRVTHWRSGAMAARWAASAFLSTELSFKRLMGYRDLPVLKAVLQRLDQAAAAAHGVA